MIPVELVTKIFMVLMGCFAFGYSIGLAQLWVSRIKDAA